VSTGESGVPTPAPPRGPSPPFGETLRLETATSSTSVARRWLRALLGGVVADDVIDDAALVASELIANSVEHTRSDEVLLSVRIDSRGLVVQVLDQGPGLPSAWPVPGHRGRSRGLMMIGKLSASVSSRVMPGGGAIIEAVLPIESGA
jgi:serine/threonine-protein kinase RsbW